MPRSWLDRQDPEAWGKGFVFAIFLIAIGLIAVECGTGTDRTVGARVVGRDFTDQSCDEDGCTGPYYYVLAVADDGEELRIDVNPGVYEDAALNDPLGCSVHEGGLFHTRTAHFLHWGAP